MPHQSSVLRIRLDNIIACLTPALPLLNDLHDAFGPPFVQTISNTTLSLITAVQVINLFSPCVNSLWAADCQEKQGWVCRAHGKHPSSPVCNCQSVYKIWDCRVSTSINCESHWKIQRVKMFSSSNMLIFDDVFSCRTLHKLYTFVEAQQDGNKIKQFFRQSEMNVLLKNCRAGLDDAVEVFKVPVVL